MDGIDKITRNMLNIAHLGLQKGFVKSNAIHAIKSQPFYGSWLDRNAKGGAIKLRRPNNYHRTAT